MLLKNENKDNVDEETYTIPEEITDTEAMIYDFVAEHYGFNEACNPSWNIEALAKYIDESKEELSTYKPLYTIAYEK